MAPLDLELLAAAWFRHWGNDEDRGHDDADWWAVELVMEADAAQKQTLVEALVDRAPDDRMLAYIGAGPLEEHLSDEPDVLAWVEAQAAASSAFRTALANVWVWDLPASAFERIERAARVRLARPD